uniref:Protein BIC1 n=1 Tax=Oryza punctata TaxID=4537 RepID=A0A0E0K0M2_ORYPU
MAPSESCAARPADQRPAVCSCGAGDQAAAGTSSDHHQQPVLLQAEAAEKKKSGRGPAPDEAAADGSGGTGDHLQQAALPLPVTRRPAASAAGAGEESARERLKRHRTEMAGRVRIPEMWGQERLLKDWVDCAVFDRPLAATRGLLTARDALAAECAPARRPPHGSTGRPLRVQNGCS